MASNGSRPAFRGRYTKTVTTVLLRAVQDGDGLRGRLKSNTLTIVETTPPIGWIPLDTHMDILECARNVLGLSQFRAAFHDVALEMFSGLLWGSLVRAAERIGGVQTFGRLTPRGWTTITRDCGTVDYESVGGEVFHLIQRDFPRPHFESGTMCDAFAGTFDAFLTRNGLPGTVRVLEFEPGLRKAVYAVPLGST